MKRGEKASILNHDRTDQARIMMIALMGRSLHLRNMQGKTAGLA